MRDWHQLSSAFDWNSAPKSLCSWVTTYPSALNLMYMLMMALVISSFDLEGIGSHIFCDFDLNDLPFFLFQHLFLFFFLPSFLLLHLLLLMNLLLRWFILQSRNVFRCLIPWSSFRNLEVLTFVLINVVAPCRLGKTCYQQVLGLPFVQVWSLMKWTCDVNTEDASLGG